MTGFLNRSDIVDLTTINPLVTEQLAPLWVQSFNNEVYLMSSGFVNDDPVLILTKFDSTYQVVWSMYLSQVFPVIPLCHFTVHNGIVWVLMNGQNGSPYVVKLSAADGTLQSEHEVWGPIDYFATPTRILADDNTLYLSGYVRSSSGGAVDEAAVWAINLSDMSTRWSYTVAEVAGAYGIHFTVLHSVGEQLYLTLDINGQNNLINLHKDIGFHGGGEYENIPDVRVRNETMSVSLSTALLVTAHNSTLEVPAEAVVTAGRQDTVADATLSTSKQLFVPAV